MGCWGVRGVRLININRDCVPAGVHAAAKAFGAEPIRDRKLEFRSTCITLTHALSLRWLLEQGAPVNGGPLCVGHLSLYSYSMLHLAVKIQDGLAPYFTHKAHFHVVWGKGIPWSAPQLARASFWFPCGLV